MEEDRLQADLGLAADIEESQLAQAGASMHPAPDGTLPEETATIRQPRKRFVGRRTAAAEAAKTGSDASIPTTSDSGAVQREYLTHLMGAYSETDNVLFRGQEP